MTIHATAETGLARPQTFYFGNLVGATGIGGGAADAAGTLRTSAHDVSATRSASTLRRVGTASRFDHNRDGRVNSLDWAIVRRAVFSSIPLPTAPPADIAAAVARQILTTNAPANRSPIRRSAYISTP